MAAIIRKAGTQIDNVSVIKRHETWLANGHPCLPQNRGTEKIVVATFPMTLA